MGILFWKKNKMIDKAAEILADEFYSQVQVQPAVDYFEGKAPADNKKASKQNNKIERMIYQTSSQINTFRKENSLGVYGKARLHLTFMNRLQELGYPEHIANRINEKILLKNH